MACFPVLTVVRKPKFYKNRRITDDTDFRSLYRFESFNVDWIADHFMGEKTERRGGALDNVTKMKIFLRYVSDPGFQTGVAEDVGCDQSTVCKTVQEVRRRIVEKRNTWIIFPNTALEILEAKELWQERFKMPCTIGTIDCTHIRILKPPLSQHGDEYINRKGFPSINVQATCNAKEWFTSVDASWPGSVHDNRIFKNSSIYKELQQQSTVSTTLLLGDSGYGVAPWVLVPFKNPQEPYMLYFNQVYAKERVIIERCFGQLKRRFPAMQYKLRTQLNRCPEMIIACFILHNVAKYLNDADDFPENEGDNPTVHDDLNDEMSNAEIRKQGQEIRNRIAQTLFNNLTNNI